MCTNRWKATHPAAAPPGLVLIIRCVLLVEFVDRTPALELKDM